MTASRGATGAVTVAVLKQRARRRRCGLDDEVERRRRAGGGALPIRELAAHRDHDAVVVDVRRSVGVPLGVVVRAPRVELAVLLLVGAELVAPVRERVAQLV